MRLLCFLLVALLLLPPAEACAQKRFSFHSVMTVDEMREYIEKNFPLGSKREDLQTAFVLQGNATLKRHPTLEGVEKYLYDINLCEYYVFRWNISADYDKDGKLLQAYINGRPVFIDGRSPQRVDFAQRSGAGARLMRTWRDWPQAKKGAKRVYYTLLDMDGDMSTIEDQSLAGYGASRADPADFGLLVKYADVEPWRSIYDEDQAIDIYDFKGSCAAADAKFLGRKLMEPQHGVLR